MTAACQIVPEKGDRLSAPGNLREISATPVHKLGNQSENPWAAFSHNQEFFLPPSLAFTVGSA